ncbi:hypothetical protein MUP77_09210 [Candidatus Bathyarchaeota archaeon]|jgi:hypothetical protein|nr:hypothetical protein [Candidatus Bathyarchaeota archaeon]
MSLRRSSCDALSAATHSENTHKHYDFQTKGKILKLAFELKKIGISEAYLKTMVRALSSLASKVSIEDPDEVSALIAHGKWRDSYKANIAL